MGRRRWLLETSVTPCGSHVGAQLKLALSPPSGTDSCGGKFAFASVSMLALTLSPTLKETTRNCSSVSPSRSSKSTRNGSGFSIQPGDKAVARAVASHDADHVAEAVSDTGTAHGDKIIRRGEAFEIAIYQRWQRIDDIVAVQGERIETGFKIADFRAAQDHFPARTVQLQQLRQRLVVQSRVTIAQRLNALFADANKRQLIIERLAGQGSSAATTPRTMYQPRR